MRVVLKSLISKHGQASRCILF